jgi:hypothetical protein
LLTACLAAPGGAQGGSAFKRAAAEIASIARVEDGSARPESVERRRRLREVLGEVAAVAFRDQEGATEARELLAGTALRRERTVAMEGALVLIELEDAAALRLLLGAVPEMEVAVRRKSLEHLQARGRGLAGAASELLRALEREDDPEALATLIELAARLDSASAVRALLAAAPPLAREAEDAAAATGEAPADSWLPAREALVAALRGERAAEVSAWLAGPAWDEAARDPGEAPRKLVPLLEAAPGAARSRCEGLLPHPDQRVARAALAAIRRLGAGPSREALEQVAALPGAPARIAAQAAVLVAELDAAAGEARLIELSGAAAWQRREAAVSALALLPASDAAFLRVVKLLEDPNREVRVGSFAALRAFHRLEAVGAALRLLEPLRGRDRALAVRYLEWASGKKLGEEHAAWAQWWRVARGSFHFPAP